MVNNELAHNYRARRSEDGRATRSGVRVPRGAQFRELCVHPADKFAYQVCRETWAANLTRIGGGAGGEESRAADDV